MHTRCFSELSWGSSHPSVAQVYLFSKSSARSVERQWEQSHPSFATQRQSGGAEVCGEFGGWEKFVADQQESQKVRMRFKNVPEVPWKSDFTMHVWDGGQWGDPVCLCLSVGAGK